jgi:hypothetical protein
MQETLSASTIDSGIRARQQQEAVAILWLCELGIAASENEAKVKPPGTVLCVFILELGKQAEDAESSSQDDRRSLPNGYEVQSLSPCRRSTGLRRRNNRITFLLRDTELASGEVEGSTIQASQLLICLF